MLNNLDVFEISNDKVIDKSNSSISEIFMRNAGISITDNFRQNIHMGNYNTIFINASNSDIINAIEDSYE